MRPTEQLVEEHEAIKLAISILGKIADKLEASAPVDPEHLKQLVEFIQVFADRCHHGKEEDLLFRAMEQAGIPTQGGPIGVMLQEHEMGRTYVLGMKEAAEVYQAGDAKAAAQFAWNARSYGNLLLQHIDKENNILYPLADRAVSADRQEELLAEFEQVEQQRIGKGRHEQFHQMLHHLRDIYLK